MKYKIVVDIVDLPLAEGVLTTKGRILKYENDQAIFDVQEGWVSKEFLQSVRVTLREGMIVHDCSSIKEEDLLKRYQRGEREVDSL